MKTSRARASGRAELVGGDDRGGIAGERRRVGREVAQHRGGESADAAPQGEEPEKGDPVLRKARGQHHDHDGADHGADHPEPALAQRSAELRLAHDRRGGAGPERIVELEPERDEEGEADGRPQPDAEQQRRARAGQHIRQAKSRACRPGCQACHGLPSSTHRRPRRSGDRDHVFIGVAGQSPAGRVGLSLWRMDALAILPLLAWPCPYRRPATGSHERPRLRRCRDLSDVRVGSKCEELALSICRPVCPR